MKAILSLIISGALVVSGFGQTRNVLVGTNNAVVQPTNFWSADASNARTGLGLGSAATNPASAFQPSSSVLSNLASGNGGDLTNITATIVGTNVSITNVSGLQAALDAKLATNGSAAGLTNFPTLNQNTTGTASNITGVVSISNGGTGATNAASARTALGGTTSGINLFTIPNPDEVRFLRINANNTVSALTAADMRTALSVGTNAGTVTSIGLTVPAIFSLSTPTITSSGTFALTLANQTSRHAFLAPNGGGTPSFRAIESDDLPSLAISKITGLQTALDGKLSTTGTAALATNVTGTVAIVNGGTGSTNAADARTALGLGTAATNAVTAFQPSSTVLSNLANNNGASLTNLTITNVGTVALASNVTGVVALANGGTGATNASGARTALELGTAATNPATAFQSASSALTNLAANNGGSLTNIVAANIVGTVGLASNITGTAPLATNVTGVVALANGGTAGTNAASARTSLGATTVGANLFTLVNPDDTRFIRLNANNTVSALSAADMRTALSVGTNLGTVTSVGMSVPNIFTLSTPTITSSGTFGITLANQSSRQAFLAPNGGGVPAFRALESDDLPSLAISKVTGLQTALDGKLSTTGTAALATNVTGVVALANGGTGGTNAESGRTGLGATTVGANLFTLFNPSAVRFIRLNADNTASALSDSDFRTALSLGTAATNPATAFQTSSANLTNLAANNGVGLTNIPLAGVVGALASNGDAINLTNFPALLLRTNGNGGGLTNLTAANITGTVGLASNVTGTIAISNGGSGATTAGGARTNLGLGSTNAVSFGPITAQGDVTIGSPNIGFGGVQKINLEEKLLMDGEWTIQGPLQIGGTNIAPWKGETRTNLGLGWSALTNTTASGFQTALFGAGTNPVLVNTNGDVVSPTNFWQAAPITTTFIESQPTTNSSTNISPSRLLHIHSLSTNVVNTTNTIILPTNSLTFEGDMAMVVHKGPTNSLTQVRQAGSTNNLITLNKFNEAVEFTYYNNAWQFLETAAFTAPIYFSGTNAAANAAESRTNLGIPLPAFTNTNNANFRTAIELGATNNVTFNNVAASGTLTVTGSVTALSNAAVGGTLTSTGVVTAMTNLNVGGAIAVTNAALTRTNLGLGAADNVSIGSDGGSLTTDDFNAATINVSGSIAFTNAATTRTNLGLGATNIVTFAGLTNNGDITINQTATNNGLLYVYRTNAEPFLGLANLIASNNVTVSNESLFRVGVAEATNKAAQFGFRSTNTNGNGVAVFSVFGYNALMMIGPSDPAAGTNPIQATVYSVSPTNKVMTLITTNTGATLFHRAIEFENTTNQAVTRTNLGLPLAALTNTNNAGFQRAIFQTNTTPTNGANLGDAKAWIEISVVTNSVTNSYRIPVFQ